MTAKNDNNLATIIASLVGDIFDMAQTVYDTLETYKKDWIKRDDFGDGRYISSGQPEREFRDKLNYAAMVTDYGLMELFATFLGTTITMQSANISLSSRGDINLSAQSIAHSNLVENKDVATPSLSVKEAIYTGKVLATGVELGKWGVNLAYGIKNRVDAAAKNPTLEAL
ncbi:MAG: hypothetical protein LBB78_08825 [Spirochaetaceae bacterium]|nr:hypothetical protein [Spirochaetaceae bacterium]